MRSWLGTRPADYALLLAVAAALTLPNLGASSLWDVDEGVNAEAAREMRESGTWVIPTFNYELRTAKPVMLYWLQRVSYETFGVSEWSARLPSVLAAWLTLLLTYELARRMFGRGTGLLAGLVLVSAIEFCVLAHAATPDAILLLFTVLTYAAFWFGHENGGRGWWVPTAMACGLACLTKGPVGVALPGLVILLYFAWNRELHRLIDRRLLWGLGAFLLVAGPWYGLVTAETRGAWAKAFFLNENLNRALTPMENHRGPIFYHAAALLALFAPWSAFIGGVLWYGVKAARRPNSPAQESNPLAPFPSEPNPPAPFPKREGGENQPPSSSPPLLGERPGEGSREHRFLLCWFAAYIVFFSLVSTKLPNYILPLYPALAILTARFLVRWREGDLPLPRWLMPAAVAVVAFIAVVVGAGLLVAGGAIPLLPSSARVFPALAKWSVLGLVPLAGAGLMGWFLLRQDRHGFVTAMAATAAVFVGLVAAFPPREFDQYKAPQALVRDSGVSHPARDIRLAACDWFQPSVVFYARREVAKLHGPDQAAEFLAIPTPGYLIIPEPAWNQWVKGKVEVPWRVAARHYDFLKNCDVLVITNE